MKKLLLFCGLLFYSAQVVFAQCEASNFPNPPTLPAYTPTLCLVENGVIDPNGCSSIGDPQLDPNCNVGVQQLLSRWVRPAGLHKLRKNNADGDCTPCVFDRDKDCFQCIDIYCEEIKRLVAYEATYINAYGFWDNDYRHFISNLNWYKMMPQITGDINAAYDCAGLKRPVIAGSLLSQVSCFAGGVSHICIPQWVIDAFISDPEFELDDYKIPNSDAYRTFDFDNIRIEELTSSDACGENQPLGHYWDITRIEARMWMYYMMVTMIEFDFKAIEMGFTRWMKNDVDFIHTRNLLKKVRQYAIDKGTFVLIVGEHRTENGIGIDLTFMEDGERHLLFDFDVVPARFRELDDPMTGYECNDLGPTPDVVDEWKIDTNSPCYGEDFPAFLDYHSAMNVLRTKIELGEYVVSPYGCQYSEVPYSVQFDLGNGVSCEQTGEVQDGWARGAYCWDDMYWFTEVIDDACAAYQISKWICEVKEFSGGLGSLQIPWSYKTPRVTENPLFYRITQDPELYEAIQNPQTNCDMTCNAIVSTNFITFPIGGGSTSFTFSIDYCWPPILEIINGESWLSIEDITVSESAGSEIYTITISCPANTTNFARGTDIQVGCRADVNSLFVFQAGPVVEPPVAPFPCKSATTSTYIPHQESFESPFSFWIQDPDDDLDWTRHSGNTPSSGTGPSAASDGSFYSYTEASTNNPNLPPGSPNKIANLVSPCFNLAEVPSPEISFDYHMFGLTMGSLALQVSTNGGLTWSTLWSMAENQGDTWHNAAVDLSNYTSQIIRLRFHGTTGLSFRSDMAIDKIRVGTTLDCYDQYEANNSFSTARVVTMESSPTTLPNACLYAGDEDYYRVFYSSTGFSNFFVKVNGKTPLTTGDYKLVVEVSGNDLVLKTLPQNGSTTDTYLSLYLNSGGSPVAEDDNDGPGLFSKIEYTLPGLLLQPEKNNPKSNITLTNYPNPFNQQTIFSFYLEEDKEVNLIISDIDGKVLGQPIRSKRFTKGNHTIDYDAGHLLPGVYTYSLQSSLGIVTKQMVIIR